MNYTLMHKNVPVANIKIDQLCNIEKIDEIFNLRHFPKCYRVDMGKQQMYMSMLAGLRDWWESRSIPQIRIEYDNVIKPLGAQNSAQLALRVFGLTMDDQFWVKPYDKPQLRWEWVTFFRNMVATPVGDFVAYKGTVLPDKVTAEKMMTPALTTHGYLPKTWYEHNNQHFLIKGGSPQYRYQEPFTEKLATNIAARLGFDHVAYSLSIFNGLPYSHCKSFVNSGTDFVSNHFIVNTFKKENNESWFNHYLKCCSYHGIDTELAKQAFAEKTLIGSIIADPDNNWKNSGWLFDADSGTVIGPAPAFDFGKGAWCTSENVSKIGIGKYKFSHVPSVSCGKFDNRDQIINSRAAPFGYGYKQTHERQLEQMGNLHFADISKLKDIPDLAYEIFKGCEQLKEDRLNGIVYGIKERINATTKIIEKSR